MYFDPEARTQRFGLAMPALWQSTSHDQGRPGGHSTGHRRIKALLDAHMFRRCDHHDHDVHPGRGQADRPQKLVEHAPGAGQR